MKNYIWLFAASMALMASCSNDDDITNNIPPTVTDDDWISPDGRVIVQLGGSGSLSGGAVVTRGPVEGTDGTQVKDFGIFALGYNNNSGVPGTPADWSADMARTGAGSWWNNDKNQCLLLNVRGFGAKPASDSELNDANDFKISLCPPDYEAAALPGESQVYYYPIQYNYFYSFYGYTPYQRSNYATSAPATTPLSVISNKITVDIPLTGAQDVMWGQNRTTSKDTDGNTVYVANDHPQEADIRNDKDNPASKETVSGYNARFIRKVKYHNELVGSSSIDQRKYIPRLVFDHKLTRLNFFVVPAEDQCQEDKEAVAGIKDINGDYTTEPKIKVVNIELMNQYETARLDVEKGTLAKAGNQKSFKMLLCGTDGKPAKDETGALDANGNVLDAVIDSTKIAIFPDDAESPKCDGYIMSWPSNTEILKLKVTLRVNTTGLSTAVPKDQTVYLYLDPQKMANKDGKSYGFLAGHAYNIKIGIYAIQEVMVDAMLTDWVQDNDYTLPVE